MAVKAVIFDFGGVVVDFANDLIISFVAQQLKIPLPLVATTLFETGRVIIEGKMNEEIFWERYAHKFNRDLPKKWKFLMQSFFKNNMRINHDVLEIISFLNKKGFLLPLLSNISPFQLEVLRSENFASIFSPFFFPFFFSCEIGLMKPDKKIFQHLLNCMKLTPQECLLVDDDQNNIESAREIGLEVIHYRHPEQLKNQLEKSLPCIGIINLKRN